MIRIVIADDQGLVREGLRLLIDKQPDMEVCGQSPDGRRIVDLLRDTNGSVLLLDLTMPVDGFDVLDDLSKSNLGVRVLVVSMHEQPSYVRRAMAAGANGYVSKRAEPKILFEAIRTVAEGGSYIDGEVHNAVKSASFDIEPKSPLSPRELEVLKFVAAGHTNQETADELGLSVKTVEGYRARVAQKLAAKTRADLVRYALQAGLL